MIKDTGFSFMRFICALVLALFLWYFINGSSNNIVTRYITDVPVSLINEDDLTQRNLALENNAQYFVNLEVRGTEESLESIDSNELIAEVDLSKIAQAGTQSVDVVIRGLNNRVILDETVPNTLQLNVDEVTNKQKDPEILAQGIPAEGYSVISISTNQTVSLEGLESELEEVAEVSGVTSVNGMQEPTERYVKVYPYDKEGNIIGGVSCNPEVVKANINIGAIKKVPLNPPTIEGKIGEGYRVTAIALEPEEVTIAGQPADLDKVQSVNVTPVDLPEGDGTQSFSAESNMQMPAGVSLLANDTKVQVSVTIEQIAERTYTVSNLETVGLGEGLVETRINPGSVRVKISGTPSELQKINGSQLKGQLNLAGKGEGIHKIKVEVSIAGGTVLSITPETVEVEISKK